MNTKKRLLTDVCLALATIGMAAGMVWADDAVECPEMDIGEFTVPAFKCPAGTECVYVAAYDTNGQLRGVAGACLVSGQPVPQ